MSLIRYTHPMLQLQQQLNRMFDQFDTDMFGRLEGLGDGMFTPPVDVKEDADAYTVHLEVPGVAQDNLHLTLQDNVLTIKGSKELKQESGEGRYRRIERSYGSFTRSLSLPRNVDASSVEANLEDGVLEVRLPKREESRPRQISVGTTQNVTAQDVTGQNLTAQSISTQDEGLQDDPAERGAAGGSTPQGDAVDVRTSEAPGGSNTPEDGNAQAAGGNSEDAPEGNPT